jgi:hypothetical protein
MKKLRTNLKAIVIIASVIAMVRPIANAQDSTKKSVDFTTNVDLYSRYLWRGMQNGNAPAIQPTIKMTYKNFSFGAWGSVQASDLSNVSLPETDLFATYTLPKGFSITVNDYFVSADEANLGNYFEYDQKSVNSLHQIEGVLAFAGLEKFPLSASVGYTFYGQKWTATAPANMNGSIYAELDYQVKNLTIIAAGGNKYYTTSTVKEDFVPVNIGVKVVQKTVITDKFTLPITGQIMINPNTKHIYYTVGFSF